MIKRLLTIAILLYLPIYGYSQYGGGPYGLGGSSSVHRDSMDINHLTGVHLNLTGTATIDTAIVNMLQVDSISNIRSLTVGSILYADTAGQAMIFQQGVQFDRRTTHRMARISYGTNDTLLTDALFLLPKLTSTRMAGTAEGDWNFPGTITSDTNASTTFRHTGTDAYFNGTVNTNKITMDLVQRANPFYYTDFYEAITNQYPWNGYTSGTAGALAAAAAATNYDVGHPGWIYMKSGTAVNAGYYFRLPNASLLLSGSEATELIFMPISVDSLTIRFGFLDNSTNAPPTDGVYITIDSTNTIMGQTASNGTIAVTDTVYTLSYLTWYRVYIYLNSGATVAYYNLYNDTGTLLWSESLTANGSTIIIPTASGRDTGHVLIATRGGVAVTQISTNILIVDYMSMWLHKGYTR